MAEWTPWETPWRMQHPAWNDWAAVELPGRRPPWWLLWTVAAVGVVSWPVAFVVVG